MVIIQCRQPEINLPFSFYKKKLFIFSVWASLNKLYI